MERLFHNNCLWFLVTVLLITACTPQTATETPTIAVELTSSSTVTITPSNTDSSQTGTVQSTATSTPSQSTSITQGGQGYIPIFVSETIPDETNLMPGQTFHKTWTFRNGGTRTWAIGFALVKTSSTPSTENLGSPDSIPLEHEVQPGEEIQIGVDLTVPLQDGRYTVYYELRNEAGQQVANSQTWVTITVGSIYSSGTSGNVSATLTGFDQNGQYATAHFCMNFPHSSRNWIVSGGASSVVLVVDQVTIAASDGGGQLNCSEFNFPLNGIDLSNAAHISVSIQAVEKDSNNFHDQCEAIKPGLQSQYPGLDFTCEGEHTFYSHLVLPAGQTSSEADKLIVDAITNKIYGPWVLTVR